MKNIPSFKSVPFGELRAARGTGDIKTPALFDACDFKNSRLVFNPIPEDDYYYDPDHCIFWEAEDLPLAGTMLDLTELTIKEVIEL